jgi:hypothetical protein
LGKFRESQTAKNLLTAFAGESQARNRYTYFARRAREDGFIQIADIFDETADQECEHALRFFKFFNGGEMEITASFPAGVIKTTLENRPPTPGMPSPYRKNSTKNATATWRPTWRPTGRLPEPKKMCGAAATAATCTSAKPLRTNARPASSPRDFSSCWLKTGKPLELK